MKLFPKLGLLLLMLMLLFGAFVLPKFVQRTEPPSPPEDLAAALVAVDGITSPASSEPPRPEAPAEAEKSPLRDDERFSTFFAAIDSGDFDAAGAAFGAFPEELSPDIRAELTEQIELAVSSLSEPPAPPVSPAAPVETVPLSENETLETQPEVSAATVVETTSLEPTPPAQAAPAVNPAETLRFMSEVQNGNFEGARKRLATMSGVIDETTLLMLEGTLSTAEAREAELQASRDQLAQSQSQMAKLQQESLIQMQASMKELAAATEAAKTAVQETAKLRENLGSQATQKATKSEDPATTPDTISVSFASGSTYVSDEGKRSLEPAAKALIAEPRLKLQLRGHADPSGNTEYNAIIARARCEIVRDYLVGQGVEPARITVISFGDTQSAGSGKTAAELRRVDAIFSAE